ncbi:MAG TPA: GGDEF domain-containing protein [Thermoanaerobaculia bacterium]|jgi:diguanylate cyclase (GGDEF)-like protein
MTRRKRLVGTALAAAAVALVGWLDYATGPEIGLSLLYLMPVAAAGWFGGVASAILIGCAAGAVWLGADVALHDAAHLPVSLWNAFTRLVIYVSEGVFLALLRRDRDMLRGLLHRETVLARTDAGTSLPNARAFLEVVDAELERVRLTGEPLCLAYVDLDHFKSINDRHGHATGDAVLQHVARALTLATRDADVVARLGGDEFGILLRRVEPDQAAAVGQRVVTCVREIGDQHSEPMLGATVGIVHARTPPQNASELLHAADNAMYAGKSSGKGRVVVQQR